jgi:signal transduction histidine kinase
MDLPLRRKLLSIVVLVALVCGPPIVIGLVLDARSRDAWEEEERTAESIEALAELEQTVLLEGGPIVERYVILGFDAPALVDEYREVMADSAGLLDTFAASVPGELAEQRDEIVTAYEATIPALDRTMYGEASAADLIGLTDLAVETLGAGARLDDALDDRVVDQRAEVDRLRGQLVVATLASLVLVLVAAVGGLYLVTNGLVRRIDRLADNAARFVRNETIRPQPRSSDEIGQLSDSLVFAGALLDTRRREALAATKAKDDFLSRVGHELKTPLTAMIGFAQLIEEDADISPDDRDDTTHIVTAGHHLHALIEELLDIKAIEAGRLAMTFDAVPVRQLAADALALVRPMADARSVQLVLDCPDDVEVHADPRRLREVLLNLLSNAVKYGYDGGRVEMAAARHEGTVHLTVTDTGPGIAPAARETVFEPFERLDAATSDVEGSGVGLALTKNVVEAMGGVIGVESQLGQGSTFWLDLPVPGARDDRRVGDRSATVEGAGGAAGATTEPQAASAGTTSTTTLPPPVPARTRVGQRWMDMSMRGKLLSIVAMGTVLCTPPIAIGLALDAEQADARAAVDQYTAADDALDTLRDAVLYRAQPLIQQHVLSGYGDPEVVERYRTVTADVPDLIADLERTVPDELDDQLADVRRAYDTVIALFDGLIDIGPEVEPGEGSTEEVLLASDGTAAAFTADVRFADLLDETIAEQRAEIDRLQGDLVWAMLGGLALALVATAGGIYLVTTGLVRRVEHLGDTAVRFIDGRPMRPTTQARDEIGQLNDTMAFAGELLDARRREALAATRAKDEFLSRVSHELKTPLTAMIGFAEMLEESSELSPQSRDDARRIAGAGRHLHELIEELLDIKAIEAGKLAMAIEPLRVGEAFDESIALVAPGAARRSIEIRVDCPPCAEVAADRRRLREVLLNLLSNAVKYNSGAGRIDVTATPDDGHVRIAVADTGPGISPEDQARLFQPFERLDAGATDVEGSGIGLALTKNVVEAMDGIVGVDSALGEGSTFWAVLPRPGAGDVVDHAATATGTSPRSRPGTRRTAARSRPR